VRALAAQGWALLLLHALPTQQWDSLTRVLYWALWMCDIIGSQSESALGQSLEAIS